MRAPSSTSKSPSERLWRVVLERVTLNCRFNFFETLRSIESSSSGVALAAGERLAPALALAAAVDEIDGEGAGVGDCPNAVRTSATEQRQVRIVVFILVALGMRCGQSRVWIQEKASMAVNLKRSEVERCVVSEHASIAFRDVNDRVDRTCPALKFGEIN